ncbi:hypothetical protein CASFOL_001979 [Castilleja foliolosa]|uniref:Uncharacterized protein n=1 Tax=Castilleja foliolosa TaxID=1961234 RepID=A0ABD3ECY8_9LAMI
MFCPYYVRLRLMKASTSPEVWYKTRYLRPSPAGKANGGDAIHVEAATWTPACHKPSKLNCSGI